jgi:nucleoside-diphosphate-sugar epimerase
MNILLTGATGFLGKEVICQNTNHTIFSLNRKYGNYKCNLSISIPDFESRKFDIVIHAAGKAHLVSKKEIINKSFFDVNVKGTENLLIGIEKSRKLPKSFVFISSVSVYGLEQGENINENAPLLAKDPYGLSKIQAERLVIDWCDKNDVICTILRLPLLVGENPPGNLGAMIKAIQKRYYFNIGGGKAKKSMVLAEDVARFIPIISPVGGTYNLTDGLNPSFLELSNTIAKREINNLPLFIAKIIGCLGDFLGKKAPINSLKIKKITSDLTFDDSKARSFGWKSQSVLKYLKHNDL